MVHEGQGNSIKKLMLDTGYSILDTGYWILDTRYWILDTGHWLLDAKCELRVAGCGTALCVQADSSKLKAQGLRIGSERI